MSYGERKERVLRDAGLLVFVELVKLRGLGDDQACAILLDEILDGSSRRFLNVTSGTDPRTLARRVQRARKNRDVLQLARRYVSDTAWTGDGRLVRRTALGDAAGTRLAWPKELRQIFE